MKSINKFKSKCQSENERCLVAEFFAKEAKKPVHKRTDMCMISCPCSKCSTGHL